MKSCQGRLPFCCRAYSSLAQAIKETVDSVQRKIQALSATGKGGGAGFKECPTSLELNPEKTPWSAVFPLFGRLRRDTSVDHLAGVRC